MKKFLKLNENNAEHSLSFWLLHFKGGLTSEAGLPRIGLAIN